MKPRLSNLWWTAAMIAAAGMLISGCSTEENDSPATSNSTLESVESTTSTTEQIPKYGGGVVMAIEAETNTWVPGTTQPTSAGQSVLISIYDPLIALNAEGDYEPFLAESFEPNSDLTEWTVTLRSGVEFHDGTKLDAETLKWNFDNLHFVEGSLTRGSLLAGGVTGMDIIDDLTVVYHLSRPNSAFPNLLRGAAGWPVSRAAYEADPAGFGDRPVGTGPFMMEEFVRDFRTVVVRNPNYWRTDSYGNQLPYLDRIEFRPISDEDSRVQSLAAGDVDVTQTLRGTAAKQVISLANNGGFMTSLDVGNSSSSALFNVLEPPVDDVRIRRALVLAGDSQHVQAVLGVDDLTEPSVSLFASDSPWFSEQAAQAYPGFGGRHLDEAIELLEEYKNDPDRSDGKAPGSTVSITYSCTTDPSLMELAQLQQALWTEAGFDVKIEQSETAVHVSKAIGSADTTPPYRGSYMTICWRSPEFSGDPLSDLQSFYGATETTPGNVTNFSDPRIDELLDVIRSNADFKTRYEAIEQISIITAEQVPIMVSAGSPRLVGYRDNIQGLTDWVLPSGSLATGTTGAVPRFYQAWIAD